MVKTIEHRVTFPVTIFSNIATTMTIMIKIKNNYFSFNYFAFPRKVPELLKEAIFKNFFFKKLLY